MNIVRKVLASLMTLLAVCLVHAADQKPIARVLNIQSVETEDPSGYAVWAAKINEVAKAKLGVDTYIHVYVTTYDGERTNSVRTVVVADSVATLTKNAAALQDDPALADIRSHLRAIRKQGARELDQCVRFDGTHKGAYVFTTHAVLSDEAAYLKALDGLRALFDGHGMQDIKVNAYRVIAGRTNYTHRITLAAPSNERLAAMLDYVATDAAAGEWLASVAKYRTVVANSTAHDIVN